MILCSICVGDKQKRIFRAFLVELYVFWYKKFELLIVKQARLACRNFRINYYAYRYRYTVLMMMTNDLVYETLTIPLKY